MLVLCEEISLLFGCLLENVPRQKEIQKNILTKFSKKKKIKRKLSMVRRGIGKIVSFRLCLHSIVSLSLSLHCFCRLLVTKTIVNKRTINSSSTRHADTIGENSNTTSSLSPCLVHGEVWKFLNFHWMEKIVNISILNQEFEFDKFLELLCFDGWYTKSTHI